MTAEELSVELGVAMPYLEDEIEALLAACVLKKSGGKFETNLVILTDEYEKEAGKRLTGLVSGSVKDVFDNIKRILPDVKNLEFSGKNYDDNRLLFMLVNIAVENGFYYANKKSPYGEPPLLKLGGHGWIYGHDSGYDNGRFIGVSLHAGLSETRTWFSVVNYRATAKYQLFNHRKFSEKTRLMISAIEEKRADCLCENEQEQLGILIDGGFISVKNGVLTAKFPVFTEDAYKELTENLLSPVIKKVGGLMIEGSDICEKLLKDRVPASVRDQCGVIAKINHRIEAGAILLETLLKAGKLNLPAGKVPLFAFGVKGNLGSG